MTDSERIVALEKIVGAAYMNGPQLTKDQFFAQMLKPANELASGDYNNGVLLKLTQYIIADQRDEINALKAAVAALEARPVGSVSVPAPGGTVTGVGVIPGFGYGCHLVAGTFEALVFIQDAPDNALRILTNHKANGDGGFTHANKKLGQQRIDIETFGVGVSYWTPLENPDGTPFQRNALDKKGGKGVIIRNHSDDNHRAPYAQIYTGLPGQGLQIGVSRTASNVMEQPTIQIEPDGTKSIG